MSKITDEMREQAVEYYSGNDLFITIARGLLKEVGLPNGLLPLQDVEECRVITIAPRKGFVWLKQKKEIEHNFKKINKRVRFAREVTAEIEDCKVTKLTGVKAKELFWVTINEISVESRESEMIVFKNNSIGISKTFPTSAFVVEDPEIKEKVAEKEILVATTDNGVAQVVVKEKKEAVPAAAADGNSALVVEEKDDADAVKASNEAAKANVVEF